MNQDRTVERIKVLMSRHGMTVEKAAEYLGVPVPTLRKWLNGDRKPNSAAARLVDVLGMVEAFAPWVHDNMLMPK